MAHTGTAMRDLRALRYDPPGHAKQGSRRTTFQSALEQCEQFLAAAREAGYATRPVQLFYALSQAGRAMVAASPNIGNQAWRVSGHGLTANTNAVSAADVAVTAAKAGLFPSVAAALGIESLVPDEPVALRELWPLLPEAAFVPLTADAMLPVLLFSPHRRPERRDVLSIPEEAEIAWIPHRVKDLYGEDHLRVREHLDRYPALRECWLQVPPPKSQLSSMWRNAGPGLCLGVRWFRSVKYRFSGPEPLITPDSRMLDDLGVASYRSADDLMVTPAIGSMSMGLHPILALWAVLLGLSSLARYAPASWSKMIDIDRSAEANAIEHLLEEAIESVPTAVLHMLTTFK